MTPFLRRAPRFLFLLLASAGALSAATVSVQVEPAQAAVGDAVTLTVTVQNGTMGRIDLPAVDGLQAVQETTTKMLSNSGGVFTVSTSQTFRLTPRRPGDFTIPGFDVPLQEGGTLRAKEVRLHVAGDAGDPGGTASAAAPGTPPDSSAATPPPPDIPAPPANNAPATPPTATPTPSAGPVILPPPGSSSLASPDAAAGANASPGGNDPTAQTVPRDPDGGPSKVFMLITPQTTDAYVGQLVPLRIDFYIRMEVMADQNSLPTIKGSDFLMNNFTVRGRASLIVLDGEQYECDTWLTAIAAPKAGDFPLAMERDTYWVKSVTSGGYDLFGLNRHSNLAHEMISSNGYTMHVHPLPVEGRPPHFTGAIGHFEVTGDAQPATVAVGEPVTLSFTVDGDGNFDYVRCPALADDPEWRTYTPSSRTNFRDEARTRGEKLFEQAVIPLKNGNVPLPACSFSYFDPTTKNYVTIPINLPAIVVTGTPRPPVPPAVTAAGGATADAAAASPDTEFWPNRPELGSLQGSLTPVYRQTWFWAVQGGMTALPLLGLALLLVRRRLALTRESAESAARRHSVRREEDAMAQAAKDGDAPAFFHAARHAVQLQLGSRWAIRPEALTLGEIRRRDPQLAEALAPLFAQADEVIYSGRAPEPLDLARWQRDVHDLLHLQPAIA